GGQPLALPFSPNPERTHRGARLCADHGEIRRVAVAAVVSAVEIALRRRDVIDERGVVVNVGEVLVTDRVLRLAAAEALYGLVRADLPEASADARTVPMPPEIKGQDCEILGLQLLGQFVPALLLAIAAQRVQEDGAGRLIAFRTGIVIPVNFDLINGIEFDPFRLRGAAP